MMSPSLALTYKKKLKNYLSLSTAPLYEFSPMTSLGTGCNRNERVGYLSFDLERHLLVKPDLKLKTISVFFLNVVAVKYPRTRTLQIITFVQGPSRG